MLAILKGEVRNYLKRPLFWLGIAIVILEVYVDVSPYLNTHYLSPGEEIVNDYPETVREGDVFEGYVPSTKEEKRKIWEGYVQETLMSEFEVDKKAAENIIYKMRDMDVQKACEYLEREYAYPWTVRDYEEGTYRKGTRDEINAYIAKKLEDKPFSYYFSRKIADFAGLTMGFFATVILSVLYMQDTRKNTYELLHTKPVSAGNYVAGKIGGGIFICLIVLMIIDLFFWILCLVSVKSSGFEVRLFDFMMAGCLYILPNMLMIVCIYGLISLLFKNPFPAVPLLMLYMVYSNMGSRNAEGVYGYYGRPLAIMVRFPGELFDTTPPPMVLLNQSFLILASIGIIFISIQLWKRRRV